MLRDHRRLSGVRERDVDVAGPVSGVELPRQRVASARRRRQRPTPDRGVTRSPQALRAAPPRPVRHSDVPGGSGPAPRRAPPRQRGDGDGAAPSRSPRRAQRVVHAALVGARGRPRRATLEMGGLEGPPNPPALGGAPAKPGRPSILVTGPCRAPKGPTDNIGVAKAPKPPAL